MLRLPSGCERNALKSAKIWGSQTSIFFFISGTLARVSYFFPGQQGKQLLLSPSLLFMVAMGALTNTITSYPNMKLCWSIFKEIQKILNKISKEKGCKVIRRWTKACIRHFYWSVTSTLPKLQDFILAQIEAFLSHVTNKHGDLPNQLFHKCAHGELTKPRVWMTKCKCMWSVAMQLLWWPLVKMSSCLCL